MMPNSLPGALQRLVGGTVYCAAVAWPWGAYAQVYGGQGLFSGALVALALALAGTWVRRGRPGIPFDLLWPVLLMGTGVAAFSVMGERSVPPSPILGCIAFLLAVFGAANQTLVYRALALSSLSAGCVAVLTVLAEFNKVFPTFFAAQGGVVGAGPAGLADALVLFSWSPVMAVALFAGRRNLAWRVASWLLPVSALCCGAALFLTARRLQESFCLWNPDYSVLALPTLPLVLLGLYLASRTAARVLILDAPCLVSLPRCLAGVLLICSLLLAFVGAFPPLGLCFSFGLVAALGVPHTRRNAEPIRLGWPWLVVVPVIAAHAVVLFPGDARDYLQQVRQVKGDSGAAGAAAFLDLVLRRFPGEAAARLEVAELELESGQVEAAADTFLAALRERRGSMVYSPSKSQAAVQFLDRLKERAAPRSGIPYERCLAGAGRTKEAVATLKTRVKAGPVVEVDLEPLQRALAALLGVETAKADLSDWTAAELLAGLKLCGDYCQSARAPEAVPRRYLPAVLTSRPTRDGRMIMVFYPGGQTGRTWRMPACSGETPGEGETWWLDPDVDADTGEWYTALAGSADVQFGNELRLSLLENASLDCGPGAGGWAVMCLLP